MKKDTNNWIDNIAYFLNEDEALEALEKHTALVFEKINFMTIISDIQSDRRSWLRNCCMGQPVCDPL